MRFGPGLSNGNNTGLMKVNKGTKFIDFVTNRTGINKDDIKIMKTRKNFGSNRANT